MKIRNSMKFFKELMEIATDLNKYNGPQKAGLSGARAVVLFLKGHIDFEKLDKAKFNEMLKILDETGSKIEN